MHKQRLELDWVGKDDVHRLEPRILIEDESEGYGSKDKSNLLIHGDNLLALKALEQDYTGKIKCVFIDPPYNTGSAFEHYDDGVEHSLWLSLIRDRLQIIKKLLSEDGSLWITIDDNEAHYLKVLCDEIFGRKSFVSSIVWENFYGRSNAAAISPSHNYILLYSKLGLDWKRVRNLLPRDEKSSSKYSNPDGDPRGSWRLGPIFAAEERHEGLMYSIKTPSGRTVSPPKGSHWRMTEPDFWKMHEEGRITFGESGDNNPAVKLFLNEVQDGLVPRTWWPHTEVGHSQEAKREIQALFPDKIPFETPKPERLLERIITIATKPGDIVLDSFAGSGTTGAVAHKMDRKWIMVEFGDQYQKYIIPRMKQVVDGKDSGGISETRAWKGGGGFRFYKLAPSLLAKDMRGNWVINPTYNAIQLAHAVCKHEGFKFWPDSSIYWKQGFSTEKDFIFVTTQFLTAEHVNKIASQMKPDETLLICAKTFRLQTGSYPRITVKKIPQMLLGRCEFGRDDYSLNVPQPVQEGLELK